jgi:hypothetical protein
MAVFSSSCTIIELSPNAGIKEILVVPPSTMMASDTITISLSDYGISDSGLLAISGWVQTSTACIVISDQPTTSVTGGDLVITAPTRVAVAYARTYKITGRSN